jgi:hypothetical protein
VFQISYNFINEGLDAWCQKNNLQHLMSLLLNWIYATQMEMKLLPKMHGVLGLLHGVNQKEGMKVWLGKKTKTDIFF